MSASFDLDPVERITAGAVGEPGHRIFYVQAAAHGQLVTLLAEKEQVQALAAALSRLLSLMPEVQDEGADVPAEDLELVEPLLPEWRAGTIGLDVDEERDRFVIVFREVPAFDEEGDEIEAELSSLRVTATRAQARALAEQAEEVSAAGRPRCRFCGYPMDAEGHTCPAMNGHRNSNA